MHNVYFVFLSRFQSLPRKLIKPGCFVAISLFASGLNSFASPQSVENVTVIEKLVAISNSIDGTILTEIDLGTLQVGSINKTTVVLENKLGQAIEFLKASVSCSCISVVVPKVELASEKKEKLVFDFAVGASERHVVKNYDVEIQTSGAAERIILKFKSKIAGIVAFADDSVVFDVMEKDNADVENGTIVLQSKHVRIVTSDISLLGDVTIEKSDGIKDLIDASLSFTKAGATLQLQRKQVRFSPRQIFGEVTLKGSSFTPRTLGIVIRERRPIEFFPNVLVFGSKSEDAISATAIVKLRKPELENPQDDLSVLCSLPDGERVSSTLSKLSTGIYRLNIEIPKSLAKKYSANIAELSLAFKTSRLDEVLIGNSRFTW